MKGVLSLRILILFGLVLVASATAAAELSLRIPVTETGLYRLVYEDLLQPSPVASERLQLYNRGQVQAIEIEDGGDGQFGPGDALLFYGVPVQRDEPEYKYTETNVYWLKTGLGAPLRMAEWSAAGSASAVSSLREKKHAEQNWAYWQQMPDGEGQDHWFWGRSLKAGSEVSFEVFLDGVVDTGGTVSLIIALHGETDNQSNPDHHTQLLLNGNKVGDFFWDGQVAKQQRFDDIPAAWLKDGANLITVQELANHDVPVDSVYVNWFEVEYGRALQAKDDRLSFSLEASASVTISGFSNTDIRIYDISDPARARRLRNPVITNNSVSFNDEFAGERRYLALVDPAIIRARPEQPSYDGMLTSNQNGADYLLITHPSLEGAAARLAQYRSDQGYRVKLVTTEQIYDEFASGLFTPQAIKDFLSYAYFNWRAPAPRFVVLLGDANLDYKDYYRTGQINHVPTYLVETTDVGETPSDNWFVSVDGDDPVPDMLVGRIPAKTVEEVSIVSDKIIAYETGTPGPWRKRWLMASGDQDPRFLEYANEWLGHKPDSFTSISINPLNYLNKLLVRGDFMRNLNGEGAAIVTYFGHGSVDRWMASYDGTGGSAIKLISSDDMNSLSNAGTLPFFVAFNCLNGMFALPAEGSWIDLPDGTRLRYDKPLPEALLFQRDEGAIAMWSPAAFAYPSEQRLIGHELFAEMFERGNTILGSVTNKAKVNAYLNDGVDRNNLDVFTLIGDPATRLRFSSDPVAAGDNEAEQGGGGVLFYWLVLLLLPFGFRLKARRKSQSGHVEETWKVKKIRN